LKDRLKIIKFLLRKKVDVNYVSTDEKRNALHYLFIYFRTENPAYYIKVLKLLVKAKIDINAFDKYENPPLKYLIMICILPFSEIQEIFLYLLKSGAKYRSKDVFGKTCLDYAAMFKEKSKFIKLVEEYEVE
jgi:ankyrin repeat protein